MGFLQRLMPALPPIEVDATTREAVEHRVQAALGGGVGDRAAALVAVRDELLWPASADWRAKAPVDDGELGCEVLLLATVAAHLFGAPDLHALRDALVQSVAFSHRERFTDGPEPVLRVARSLAQRTDDLPAVVVSLTGHRLGLHQRRGGSEGWFLLGTLAWIAGETLTPEPA